MVNEDLGLESDAINLEVETAQRAPDAVGLEVVADALKVEVDAP